MSCSVPARARHFLIETADESAVDEAVSLKRNKPDREVGSVNRTFQKEKKPTDHIEKKITKICLERCRKNPSEECQDCESVCGLWFETKKGSRCFQMVMNG